ncbi:MAG TPA: GNAT family N-acetyltransferase [Saprospiraceae bacterium]|nr:GNAT family N-acetyltransferase [Saprospiraceae bacterium]
MDKLDNPAWNALNESHRDFARGDDRIKRYDPVFAPFGGIAGDTNTMEMRSGYVPENDFCYLIGALPALPPEYVLEKQLVCLQMVCPERISMEMLEHIRVLGDAEATDLSNLINLVQPGYFRENTRLMGDYFGIYKDNMLIAVAGERMRMRGFTEISAVVTRPGFTGRGLAGQLVAYAVNKNLADGQIPFLHVTEDNTRAIGLYTKLGFQTRRKMDFWKIVRV